ncbi:MAG: hypothetical protein CVV28_11230 [Methanobacteriales archaeon HGW-Methanobacteriales-1]|jgi:hypothetical protein|nr:MAG: hypothetical protein CVV28_11230 [Methanobacteriales archaeon HGW-Methanobacteriales-1]
MNKKPENKRVYATIIIGLLWLLSLGLWLFFYAESYSIMQNIAVFIISLVIVGAISVALWVPWGMKNT